MLQIIDVDYIEDFRLALAFSDGFEGIVDLKDIFSSHPFRACHQIRRVKGSSQKNQGRSQINPT
ncbi:DUF2442 domain-containing protein [Beggiatoa leptomitoformis]|uniref:DUF2442 domain-containing protein n=1 Tax=Beggiatoa leptomitoformis TaxID=288004 RepID=A0A2N9YFU0_9GAMM|nr:DUF2442 domain-containing protein [Beggiatoa leptomitoformis]QGX03743.1 DUF2442 domain-containing protein [Beggiatoa leptomitoformis]